MNKDLYIQLLEDHVADLTAAMNIDSFITKRKNEKIQCLDELLSKVADTVLDCQDDLNDLQADWAESVENASNSLITVVGQRTSANSENVRLQGKIAALEKEKDHLLKRNEQLSADLAAADKRIKEAEGQAETDKTTKDNLLKSVFELQEKVRKLESAEKAPVKELKR